MVAFKVFIAIHLMIEEGQLDAMLHYVLEKRTKSQSVNSQKVSDILRICWEGLDILAKPLSSVLCNSNSQDIS